MKKISELITAGLLILLLLSQGCQSKLPEQGDISKSNIVLLDQDSTRFSFPKDIRGKNYYVAMIFTHCPDICPMTTNNMQRIEEKLQENRLKDFEFIVVSFDPERDTPSILKQYAGLRGISGHNWHFLTGRPEDIDSLKRLLKIVAVKNEEDEKSEGISDYYFVHTDRLTLIDSDGKIRKRYKGSDINMNEIIHDAREL